MIDIELMMRAWVRWKDRLDEAEIRRDCGFKPYGIEYRIMLEGAAAKVESKGMADNDLLLWMDQAWRNVFQDFPKEMDAVYIYYLRKKSYRAVRYHIQCSQHMSKVLVKRGEDMLRGALCVIMDKSRF